MENYLFLILVAVVGVIRWLLQAAENKKNAEAQKRAQPSPTATATSSSPAPAPQRTAPQSEEEHVRKFFEALGVPTSETPPPRVQPRSVTPKPAPQDRKFLPVDPFPVPSARAAQKSPTPVVVAPPPLPTVAIPPLAEAKPLPTREIRATAMPDPWAVTTSGFDLQEVGAADKSTKSDSGGAALAARLASPQGLRDAIVLREIFGTPRGLQPLAGAAIE